MVTQSLAQPEPSLSVALTSVVSALQESTSLRLELASERLVERAEGAARKAVAWTACVASLVVAWIGAQAAFAIWVSDERGPVAAGLAIAVIHLFGAFVFFLIARAAAAKTAAPVSSSAEAS